MREWPSVLEVWYQFIIIYSQSGSYCLVHVEVSISTKSSSENHIQFSFGQRTIDSIIELIPFGRYWIIRVVLAARRTGEFTEDDRTIVRVIPLGMQVAKFVYAGEGDVGVRIVYHASSLEVSDGQYLLVKVQRAPPQHTGPVTKITIDWTRV